MQAAPRNSAVDVTLGKGECRLGVFSRATRIPFPVVDGWARRAPSTVRRVGRYRVINVAEFIASLSLAQQSRVLAALAEYEREKAQPKPPRPAARWPRPDADLVSQWAWDKNDD